MKTNFNPSKCRSDCKKPQNFIKRNWPKYMEKIEAKKAAKLAEAAQAKILERTPVKDLLDFSGEELGYFMGPNGERIKTIFPR